MRNTVYTFIIFLILSWLIEFGLGLLWLRWYWGTVWMGLDQGSMSASLAHILSFFSVPHGVEASPRHQRWTEQDVLTLLTWLFVVVHVVYAVWFGLLAPKWQRWRLGARRPSQREQVQFAGAYAQLACRDGLLRSLPRLWRVADGMGLQSRWIGYVLVLDRELLSAPFFPAILAHELGHANSEDRLAHRLYAMLPRIKAIACLFGGFAFGIGHVLLFPLWAWYWRSRMYAADSFAVQRGQGHALVKALNGLYLKLDITTKYGRIFKPVPYVEQRIDRLKRLLEP